MKLFICGQKYFGWMIFNLAKRLGHEVVGVCAPDGDRLYRHAYELDTPTLIRSGGLTCEVMPSEVDLIIAAHSHDFIGMKTLGKTKLGGIGYHPSLLPLHRGRDAIKWTIRCNDKVTGGSVYWLDKNVDGGAIACQDWRFVPKGSTASSLWRDVLQPLGAELITRTLRDISEGRIVAIPQDESVATWEPALDSKPLYRPDLAQLGCIPGYQVQKTSPHHSNGESSTFDWRQLAGS